MRQVSLLVEQRGDSGRRSVHVEIPGHGASEERQRTGARRWAYAGMSGAMVLAWADAVPLPRHGLGHSAVLIVLVLAMMAVLASFGGIFRFLRIHGLTNGETPDVAAETAVRGTGRWAWFLLW